LRPGTKIEKYRGVKGGKYRERDRGRERERESERVRVSEEEVTQINLKKENRKACFVRIKVIRATPHQSCVKVLSSRPYCLL